MDYLELAKTLAEIGVAGVLATGLIVVWKTWRAERKEHRALIDDLADKLQKASQERHQEIIELIRSYERFMAESNQQFQNLANQVQQTLTLLLNRGTPGGQ